MSIACTSPSAGTVLERLELVGRERSVAAVPVADDLSLRVGRVDERLQGARTLVAEVVAVGPAGTSALRRRGRAEAIDLVVELVEELVAQRERGHGADEQRHDRDQRDRRERPAAP